MPKIIPCLWYNDQAEEAVDFYLSVFGNGRITGITRYSDGTFMPAGTVMTVNFILNGQEYTALNGGPMYTFTPAISLMMPCTTQEEIDRFWEKLGAGGEYQPCGWLIDKFGVSWQVVPDFLDEMFNDPDPQRSQQATAALLKMGKIDIATLTRAWKGM